MRYWSRMNSKFFTTEHLSGFSYATTLVVTSEWGILNLDAAISSLKDRWFTFGLEIVSNHTFSGLKLSVRS